MSVQVVIITGAASGIGAAIALKFAELNAGVCITDKNQQDLRKTLVECQKLTKRKVLEIIADVTKVEDRENIVKCALEEFGKIDVLINCAGIYHKSDLEDTDIIEKFDKMFAVNARSIVALTSTALPALIENKGCVIIISSVCSTLMTDDGLIYCMTKAAVTKFTKCAAFELAKKGVRVNCISPGPVKTNVLKNCVASEEENNAIWNNFAEMVPLKKCVKAEDIADLAVYLASEKAASITGSDFVIDSGMLLLHGR